MSRLAFAIGLFTACTACTAFGAQITEVLPTGYSDGEYDYPAYIEIYAPEAEQAFDLVVFDAAPWRAGDVKQVVTIDPLSGVDTYLLYEEGWPSGDPMVAGGVPVADELAMAESYGGARTLALYEHTTDFNVGGPPSDLQQDGILDLVTYSIGDLVPAEPFQDETTLSLNDGDGLTRISDGGSYTDEFLTGPITRHNDRLFINGDTRLNPGFTNLGPDLTPGDVTSVPEPATLGLWGMVIAATLAARTGRGRREDRRTVRNRPAPSAAGR